MTKTKTRILFWGIQRSGNHAVINWLREQYEEPKMFLNHQEFGQELKASPEYSLASLGKEHNKSPKVYYTHKDTPNWQEMWRNPPDGSNELLLVSFENYKLNTLSPERYQKGADLIDESIVGKSAQTINILVLRDPFNMWVGNMPGNKQHDPQLWKIYAQEFVGETSFLPNKVCINFNKWFSNQDYRKEISRQLGVTFSDQGLNVVSNRGGGSTFDGTKFDGQAQKMNVLGRWEESDNFIKKRRLFKALRSDKKMDELVAKIYPELYGKWKKPSWENFWYYWI